MLQLRTIKKLFNRICPYSSETFYSERFNSRQDL